MIRYAVVRTPLCLAVVVAGCTKPGDTPAPATVNEEPPVIARDDEAGRSVSARRLAGTLRGGVVAIGAETTGWVLETDDGRRVDVDVSNARDAADKFQGTRVVIEGAVVTANWVERGEGQILMADSIAPAEGGK